jgi:hypothetical protein
MIFLDGCTTLTIVRIHHRLAQLHCELGKGVKGDVLRNVSGAGPVADHMNEPTALAVAQE